jgi:hypothetical protein
VVSRMKAVSRDIVTSVPISCAVFWVGTLLLLLISVFVNCSHLVFLFLILGDRFTAALGDRSFSTRVPARPPADRLDIDRLCCLFAPLPQTGSSGKGRELG